MSANRRHATAPELGWDDLADAAGSDVFRAQGRVYTRDDFRVVRFNRSVRIVELGTLPSGEPVATLMRVRVDRATGLWHDTGESFDVEWRRLDWVSFKASGDPNGTWMKVTVEGRSQFGPWSVDERNNVVHIDGRMASFGAREEAVAFAVRHLTA